MPGLVVSLTGGVFLFRLRDQCLRRVGLGNRDVRSFGRRVEFWRSRFRDGGGGGGVRREKGCLTDLCRSASRCQKSGCESDQENGANRSHLLRKSLFNSLLANPLRCYYAVKLRVNEMGRVARNLLVAKYLNMIRFRRVPVPVPGHQSGPQRPRCPPTIESLPATRPAIATVWRSVRCATRVRGRTPWTPRRRGWSPGTRALAGQ